MAQGRKKSSEMNSSLDKQIDENLRRVFDETAQEALPDRFMDLIAQLKENDKGNANGK
ncbi:NepR family anti-sigma factor [Hasllibacter sp. MH4015]|uniref:NepR family anti-sigma factor n=1 Tax=Hasllibacter sp. MH4015 TaxID=2854029 RepID=UPI001CD4022F|nr:NepR family anti-sigma factor [Hasllibacter sp. MH4015]